METEEYTCIQGDVLDQVILNHYGQCSGELLLQVMRLNTHLLALDVLPLGTKVKLPKLEVSNVIEEEQLWD